MSTPDLVVRYRRDVEETCTGEICLIWSDGSVPATLLLPFEALPFNKMMSHTSRILNERTVGRLSFERTDRPGLRPFVMDNPTVELLRTDPVAAIQAMTVPSIHIDLRKDKSVATSPPVFTAGYDTLAESFGDHVFVRVRGNEVECPGCGMWSPFAESGTLHCYKKCFLSVPARFVAGWAAISVEALLSLNLERYFLPRGWNKTLVFITHADLSALYDQWKKERTS